ncbi:MAG TPA: glutathione S-transferase [Caulobacteraceae bacterium]|jgi:glutathione S-transferase|nr:glutathione S-transferase [Caulobacteraceae bacterium]
MLKVHHLNNSRSQRILWLLEELGLDYEIIPYRRDATTNLAPPELMQVHPLGKSPVIEDGRIRIAESGAIVEYVVDRHGGGRLQPDPKSDAHVAYNEWLHYAEGSAMLPLMMNLYVLRLGEAAAPLLPRIESEIANNLAYVSGALGDRDYLMGEFSGADVQISFVMEVARAFGKLAAYPSLDAYLNRLHGRPAFKRSLEKGGAYNLAG